jgi:PIN domain nuclease of toxin-antitoxin system
MTRLLLDTHVFLWYISGDARLPAPVVDAIRQAVEVFLSPVSIWECVIKQQLGKLPLPQPAQTYLPQQRERHQIESLALTESCIRHLATLPMLHRDPFDRILICQALENGLTLVTVDEAVLAYPVTLLRT